MSWIVFFVVLLLLIALIYRFAGLRFSGINYRYSIGYFILKIVFSFAVWAVYTFYYTDRKSSDIYKFYDDGQILSHSASAQPEAFVSYFFYNKNKPTVIVPMLHWTRGFNDRMPFNENRLMIRMHTLLHFISFQNFHTHQLLFCFLSYLGAVWLYNLSLLIFPWLTMPLRLSAIAFPSFLFWTSGALKESLLLFSTGMTFYFFYLFFHHKTAKYFIGFITGLLFLIYIKIILGLMVLGAILLLPVFHNKSHWLAIAKYLCGALLVLAVVHALSSVEWVGRYSSFFYYKQFDAVNEAVAAQAKSISKVPAITKNILSLIPAFPIGVVYGLMKPFPSLSKNPLLLLAMLENIVFFLLLLWAGYLFFMRKIRIVSSFEWVAWLLAIAIGYIGLLGILTPVVGNLVRYRAVLLPLLFYTIFALVFYKEKNDLP